MSKRPRSLLLRLPVAFVAGIVLAFAMVQVLARTAAISAPANLFAWFKGHGLLPLVLFAWDTLVVYGLSIALPVAVCFVLVFRLFPSHRIALAASLGIGVLSSLFWFVPLYFGQASVSPFILPWWQQGLVASLLLAFCIALGVSRMFRITIRSSGLRV
jgi:hypothetical protein